MKKLSAIKLQKLLCKALTEAYHNDSRSPGLSVAYLRNNMYYVSIVRYNGYNEYNGKTVLYKAQGLSLTEALKAVINQWLPQNSTMCKDELIHYIKGGL